MVTDSRQAAVSPPNAPALLTAAPPTVPGTLAAHSSPPKPCLANLRATLARFAPASATNTGSPRTSSTSARAADALMTSPATPASAISRLDPPPMIRTGRSWSRAQRNPSARSWPDLARTNQSAGPPTRSEVYGASGTCCSGVTPSSQHGDQSVGKEGDVAGAHGQHDIAWLRARDHGLDGFLK